MRRTVSDAAYDALRQRLEAIEAKFPELVAKDSPSQKSCRPARGFAKVHTAVPMLSLGNAFSDEDVTEFVERIRRFSSSMPTFSSAGRRAEDRRACRCRALRERRAGSRGDAWRRLYRRRRHRQCSHHQDIPHHLKGRNILRLRMRGEVYMLKKDFLELNKKQAEADDTIFANPRIRRRDRYARRTSRSRRRGR